MAGTEQAWGRGRVRQDRLEGQHPGIEAEHTAAYWEWCGHGAATGRKVLGQEGKEFVRAAGNLTRKLLGHSPWDFATNEVGSIRRQTKLLLPRIPWDSVDSGDRGHWWIQNSQHGHGNPQESC